MVGPSDKLISYSVDIVGLSKSFQRKTVKRGYSTIKSALAGMFRKKTPASQAQEHCVIRELTMRIPRGASMGVIGKNGSGKSTLLKLITGIYRPNKGYVTLQGRVAALIELGAGFHPDFTGRENVYLGGVMHGLSRKEIDAVFDDIVGFAELEAVIDDPVRTYSSGMFMRLGFSLAVHTNPDILIVDEVLAVGDARFVAKCKDKVSELRREGKTLFLVSHDLEAVERWCDEVIWLHEGEVKDRGDPRRVIDHYRQWVEKTEELELFEATSSQYAASSDKDAIQNGARENGNDAGDSNAAAKSRRWGSREIEITNVELFAVQHEKKRVFHPEDEITVEVKYLINQVVDDVVFGIGINRGDGITVFGTNTDIDSVVVPVISDIGAKQGILSFTMSKNQLADGKYSIDVACHRKDGYPFDYQQSVIEFSVRSAGKQVGMYLPDRTWRFSGPTVEGGSDDAQ